MQKSTSYMDDEWNYIITLTQKLPMKISTMDRTMIWFLHEIFGALKGFTENLTGTNGSLTLWAQWDWEAFTGAKTGEI